MFMKEPQHQSQVIFDCSKSSWFGVIDKIYVCSVFKYFTRMANNYNFYINCFYDPGAVAAMVQKILKDF